jgi:pimeloyl-ACP methyl ester carboxylesterase
MPTDPKDGPWRHRMVTANGIRLHAVEAGDESAPLVLLLHGFPEFWWAWRAQLPALAEAGYRAVALDLRGYGESDKPPSGYDPTTLSADVAGVIRALGRPDAHLVGHGWGAWVVWATAALRSGSVRSATILSMPHPRRMRAALLRDTRQIARSGRLLTAAAVPFVLERQLVEDDAALVGTYLRDWSAPGWPDEETSWVYRRQMSAPGVARAALEYHRWALRGLVRPAGIRFAQRMATPVTAPVLQLHGRLDGAILPSSARGSDRYVAGPYTWRLYEDAGHFVHEEVPSLVTADLLTFLGTPSH